MYHIWFSWHPSLRANHWRARCDAMNPRWTRNLGLAVVLIAGMFGWERGLTTGVVVIIYQLGELCITLQKR